LGEVTIRAMMLESIMHGHRIDDARKNYA
jgi:hypothetical protein